MNIRKSLCVIVVSFAMTGCVEKEIIDDVNIEMGIGYDLLENNEIEGTILVPIFKPDKNIDNFIFSTTASSTRDLLQEIQRKSAQPVVTGSLEIAIFGEKISKNGIIDLIDSFERDPSIGGRTYLAVGEDNAKKILSGSYGNRGNAIHLSNLIKHNTESRNLPQTNLHSFLSDFYQKGKTPYLPIIKKIEPEIIDIVGIGLFKNDKMIDTIPSDQMFYFKLLTDNFSQGNFKIKVGEGQAAIRDIDSKRKIKLQKRDPYSITIEIKIKGLIREYTGNMLNPSTIKQIEEAIETEVNERCTTMLASFQEHGIDPVGLGHFIKSKTRGFDFRRWEDDYKSLTVHVKTDAFITEVGVIE